MRVTITKKESFKSESAGVSQKKWKAMTTSQKKAYIKKYPNSKYAKKTVAVKTNNASKVKNLKKKLADIEESINVNRNDIDDFVDSVMDEDDPEDIKVLKSMKQEDKDLTVMKNKIKLQLSKIK